MAGHDYSKVQKYGELCAITTGHVDFGSLDRIKFTVAEGIKETTADDYLVLSGTIVLNVIAAVLWYHKHGTVKLLVYDRDNKYRELVMNTHNSVQLIELCS